jgi:ubiquinone/menaquinone biosynthesis C-methylase UbiE
MSLQKEAFINYEANSWFHRNKATIFNYKTENDPVISLLKKYKLELTTVVEIGSSAGYRLNGIKEIFNVPNVIGVEPSLDAINFGKEKYSCVKFLNGTIDDLSEIQEKSVDLLIIGFVFYVVDRSLLYKSIYELNRILSENGKIIILDFYSTFPVQKEYGHISDFKAFTFKGDYVSIFTSSGLYQLVDFSTYDHSTMINNCELSTDDLVSLSLIRKVKNDIV